MRQQVAGAWFPWAVCRPSAWAVLLAGCVPAHSDAPPPAFAGGTAAAAPEQKAVTRDPYTADQAHSGRDPKTPEQQAWLGVLLRAQPPNRAGVLVESVEPDSPAQVAGVLSGDVLLSINGRSVNSPDEVRSTVITVGTNSRCNLALNRGEEHKLLVARLEAFPGFDTLLRRRHVGKPAPAWGGLSSAGNSQTLSLNELRGQVVVLEFWASWCTACRALLPTINRWHDEFSSSGVRVVGITSEPLAEASNAAVALDIHYPVMVDPEGTTTLAYSARMLPTVYIIDQRGVIQDMMIGFEYDRVAQVEGLIKQLLANRL